MKVTQVLDFFCDFYKDFDRAAAEAMLAQLQIAPNQVLKQMSKGTKEKVQLILAMSRKAKLYLLDEPIGGVDPATRDYILHTILTNYNPEAAVIISTHLIGDVEQILDEVVFLSRGQIALHDSCERDPRAAGKIRRPTFPGGIQMLGKLMKYELRATSRTMLPLLLVNASSERLYAHRCDRCRPAYSTIQSSTECSQHASHHSPLFSRMVGNRRVQRRPHGRALPQKPDDGRGLPHVHASRECPSSFCGQSCSCPCSGSSPCSAVDALAILLCHL